MEQMRNATPPSTTRMRLHTPPAPRYGPQEDTWTPFTPRRSSRVAAKRHSSPISPESPIKQAPPSPTRLSKRPSTLTKVRKQRRESPMSSDEELQSSRMTKGNLFGTAKTNGEKADFSANMLLTPAKTPRTKRQLPKEVVSSASRVLFHPRLANVDEAMPTLKKARKSKAFSLNPFSDEGSASATKKIEVYEDSKERIPTEVQDEDNPFVSKPAASQQSTTARSRRQSERDARMDESVRKEEGLIYVFRGKKVFRRYDETEVNDDDNLSDLEITRRAGVTPPPRLTRTNAKPRILFPSEEQRKAEEADEEALTDIEVPSPTAKKTAIECEYPAPKESIPAPEPQPESVIEEPAETAPVEQSVASNEISEPTNKHLARPKKPRASSPFDKWSRIKPSVSAPAQIKTNKRSASPMEQPSKRMRSEAS